MKEKHRYMRELKSDVNNIKETLAMKKCNEQCVNEIKKEKDAMPFTEPPLSKETPEKLDSKEVNTASVKNRKKEVIDNLRIQPINKGIQRVLAIFQKFLKPNLNEISEKIDWLCSRKKTIERLSCSLKKYEEDFVTEKVLKPLFYDLILLYDSLCSAKKRLNKKSEETFKLLEGLEMEVLQTLERYNINLMSNINKNFNPAKQKVVKINYTKSLSEEEVIIVRRGFYYGKQVLRYEEVIINKLNKEKQNGKLNGRD